MNASVCVFVCACSFLSLSEGTRCIPNAAVDRWVVEKTFPLTYPAFYSERRCRNMTQVLIMFCVCVIRAM